MQPASSTFNILGMLNSTTSLPILSKHHEQVDKLLLDYNALNNAYNA